MFGKCNHMFGDVDWSNRTQRCWKCNKVIAVECPHKWETIEVRSILNMHNGIVGRMYIQRCATCGELKTFKADVY